ncbi:MAG: hypothetical protein J6A20_08230 [Muribaculaceae bacterium]|nr:hypothetical protein [Muribaculaceae bacterium]
MIAETPTPQEQPLETATCHRGFSIGLPKCDNPAERRFPLTPEAAGQLIERGFRVKMQEGAAESIHYTDNQYMRAGVSVGTREEALGCDIVIHLAPLEPSEVRKMRRGAMLLTLLKPSDQNVYSVKELLRRHIIAIAIDLIEDERGCTPFADILAEIDGRASIAMASSLLADSQRGKGILLGGVAGIVPCETLIIGSGIAACAAARSAVGLGSMVRMYDNDVYSLRRASQELGPWVITSTLHPRTLDNALRSADVVVVCDTREPFSVGNDLVATMKRGVLAFDLSSGAGVAFPSMTAVDLAQASAMESSSKIENRICFIHAGCAVARTAAMALSNTFLTLMQSIITCEGVGNALKLLPGMQKATFTFFGKIVNPRIAREVGMRNVDISIYLTLS